MSEWGSASAVTIYVLNGLRGRTTTTNTQVNTLKHFKLIHVPWRSSFNDVIVVLFLIASASDAAPSSPMRSPEYVVCCLLVYACGRVYVFV